MLTSQKCLEGLSVQLTLLWTFLSLEFFQQHIPSYPHVVQDSCNISCTHSQAWQSLISSCSFLRRRNGPSLQETCQDLNEPPPSCSNAQPPSCVHLHPWVHLSPPLARYGIPLADLDSQDHSYSWDHSFMPDGI